MVFFLGGSGFRKGKSTTGAVLALVEEVRWAFEDSGSVALTLCDLSKAFNCVNQKAIDSKMLWLCRRVSIDGANSEELHVPFGVPSGLHTGSFPLFSFSLMILTISGPSPLCQ